MMRSDVTSLQKLVVRLPLRLLSIFLLNLLSCIHSTAIVKVRSLCYWLTESKTQLWPRPLLQYNALWKYDVSRNMGCLIMRRKVFGVKNIR